MLSVIYDVLTVVLGIMLFMATWHFIGFILVTFFDPFNRTGRVLKDPDSVNLIVFLFVILVFTPACYLYTSVMYRAQSRK